MLMHARGCQKLPEAVRGCQRSLICRLENFPGAVPLLYLTCTSIEVSGGLWSWTPLTGSGVGRSARILWVGGGWLLAKICMMVIGLARAARLMVGGGHLGQVLYQITIIQYEIFIAILLAMHFVTTWKDYSSILYCNQNVSLLCDLFKLSGLIFLLGIFSGWS